MSVRVCVFLAFTLMACGGPTMPQAPLGDSGVFVPDSDAASRLGDAGAPQDARTDSQESDAGSPCPGACHFAGDGYTWSPPSRLADGSCSFSSDTFRCGDSCDPMLGCPDGGAP